MNKDELNLLKEIRSYLNNIGLGSIYGNLGRMWAIIHNQLLNDNPKCYSIDKDGNRRIPQFNETDKALLNEIGCCIDDMLSEKELYTKINILIDKYEQNKENI